jgi:hypothetical protein
MEANIYTDSLGMGVLVGGELLRTGLQNGSLSIAVAGAIICGSSMVLGFSVAHDRSKDADHPKDVKAD